MDKRMAKALEGSIDKWQKIVDYLRYLRCIDYNRLHGLERGSDNCPLCQLSKESCGCRPLCIIPIKTGRTCSNTPYGKFNQALFTYSHRKIKYYAKKELEFLKSLRD